jgi:SAM-dependent methyltransferase
MPDPTWTEQYVAIMRAVMVSLQDDLRRAGPREVAVLGCGRGAETRWLATLLPGARVDAYDSDDDALAVTRQRLATRGIGNVTLHRADITDPTGVPARSYQLVVCFFTLHLLRSPADTLARWAGRASDDAVLVTADWQTTRPLPPIPEPWQQHRAERWAFTVPNPHHPTTTGVTLRRSRRHDRHCVASAAALRTYGGGRD